MTPKEKAQELFNKYSAVAESIEWTTNKEILVKAEKTNDELGDDVLIYWHELAKQSALIALEFANEFADDSYRSCYGYKHTMEYLEQVKHEITQL